MQINPREVTKQEFNNMEMNNKTALVISGGELIDERVIYGKYHIKMYSMRHFFVEVWIDVKKVEVEKIRAIESEADWSGYLDSIRISDLN